MLNINDLSITSAIKSLASGEVTANQLVEYSAEQIKKYNEKLKVFITIMNMVSIRPEEHGATRPSGITNSPITNYQLPNIPIAVKDLFDTADILTTSGSKFFSDYIPNEDAVAVQKIKSAGAFIVGKTNTHEVALGVTGNNPHYGTARNPYDPTRIPGGSSSGSAIAVSTGMALGALGTDTGGSIRIPASLCGVVGFKPTFGRVSLRGVRPLSWNLDHVGPLTRTVEDAALLLNILAGYDALDPTSANVPTENFLASLNDGVKNFRVAFAVGDYFEDVDEEVRHAVRDAANLFKALGAGVEDVDASFLREAALANGQMVIADGASYHRERLQTNPSWFGADVLQRLQMGAALSSSDYAIARRTQTEMKRRMDILFTDNDILLTPTTPIPAPLIEGNDAVEQARRLTRFTAPFNLTGLPALSIPCGFTQSGLPIGLQIISRTWAEFLVLQAGQAFQQNTDWHLKRP